MPFGAPKPWNSKAEREDGGSVTNLIGNWFLLQNLTATDIKKWPTNQSHERAKHFVKFSVGGNSKTQLSQYAELIKSKDNYFNTQKINSRTRSLIRNLNELFPMSGPKYDLHETRGIPENGKEEIM